MMLSTQSPFNAWLWLVVAMYRPMFSRAWLEVVTISKSARKLKVEPLTQLVIAAPVIGSRTFVTFAILTSLAVQLSFCFWTLLYSSCKQVCADAGVAVMTTAIKTIANRTDRFHVKHRTPLENLVPMMVFLL